MVGVQASRALNPHQQDCVHFAYTVLVAIPLQDTKVSAVLAQVCALSGIGLLVVVGTAAPLVFMWITERRSRQTFAWRLRGKDAGGFAADKDDGRSVSGPADDGAAADVAAGKDGSCSDLASFDGAASVRSGGGGNEQGEGDVLVVAASAAVA